MIETRWSVTGPLRDSIMRGETPVLPSYALEDVDLVAVYGEVDETIASVVSLANELGVPVVYR